MALYPWQELSTKYSPAARADCASRERTGDLEGHASGSRTNAGRTCGGFGQLLASRRRVRDLLGGAFVASAAGTDADDAVRAAVKNMRSILVGKVAMAKILVPIALPLVAVVALRIPLKQLLLGLVKTVL